MKNLSVRNVPDPLYRSLVEMAGRNRRSLQQQVLVILERARALEGIPPSQAAARIRQKLAGRRLGDTVAEVRAERSR